MSSNALQFPNLGPRAIGTVAPAQSGTSTPLLGLSQDVPPVVAQNNLLLDGLISPVVQKFDFVGLNAGQGLSYNQKVSGVYNIAVVATAIAPLISYSQAQLDIAISYTDNEGPQYNDAALFIAANGQPSGINEVVFAAAVPPITIFSSFVTFGIAGALPANIWNVSVITGGTGTAAYGATLHQATSGATAFYYGSGISLGGVPGFMLYTVLTGVDGSDSGYVWTDPVSGQTFTPNSSTSAGTFTGPGFGVSMTQFVTGAFGLEMDAAPTTILHLGPHVSGTPDMPSGFIAIPGPAPSTTRNYAWYDPVNGGTFVPTALWTDAATRITFTYNEHSRISLVG
jgi:hypothetical protein